MKDQQPTGRSEYLNLKQKIKLLKKATKKNANPKPNNKSK